MNMVVDDGDSTDDDHDIGKTRGLCAGKMLDGSGKTDKRVEVKGTRTGKGLPYCDVTSNANKTEVDSGTPLAQ